jgi:hypothetical protein
MGKGEPMRRFAVYSVLALFVATLVASDASAYRRRRQCGNSCCMSGQAYGVTFTSYGCNGGSGTYTAPDTAVVSCFLERLRDGAMFQCTVNGTYGTWSCSCTAPSAGTYRLCVVGNVTGPVCSPWFTCL